MVLLLLEAGLGDRVSYGANEKIVRVHYKSSAHDKSGHRVP